MDENNKFDVVGTNIAEKATMIWNVADICKVLCESLQSFQTRRSG